MKKIYLSFVSNLCNLCNSLIFYYLIVYICASTVRNLRKHWTSVMENIYKLILRLFQFCLVFTLNYNIGYCRNYSKNIKTHTCRSRDILCNNECIAIAKSSEYNLKSSINKCNRKSKVMIGNESLACYVSNILHAVWNYSNCQKTRQYCFRLR